MNAVSTIAALLMLARAAPPAPGGPELRVRDDARRRTLTVEVGPVSLPPGAGYHDAVQPFAVGGTLGVDGWLRSFRIEIVDGAGRLLPDARLHHASLLAPRERDLFSPTARRIVAFGMETEPIRLPGQLGYRVVPADSVVVAAALFNSGPVALDDVHLRMTMVYADARRDARHLGVLPLYLDAVPRNGGQFEVPPGGTTRSCEWTPAVSGLVLGLGGHLHQHGRAVILEDLTTGELLWRGEALYDEEGRLAGVSRSIFLRGLRITPHHRYRVTAAYANDTDEVVTGAMGHIGGIFLPDRDQSMPAADTDDPVYLEDLYAVLAAPAHHHH